MIGSENDLIVYEGKLLGDHFNIATFESREIYENYYFSEAAQAAKKIRLEASETVFTLGFDAEDQETVLLIWE